MTACDPHPDSRQQQAGPYGPLDEPSTRIIDAEVISADSNQEQKCSQRELWLGLVGMVVFGWGLYSLAVYAWDLVQGVLHE